ncbi:MAG TPA: hypothetical protein VM782_06815 [Stellaceae bacterium]|nr:hypothetical protein [Stellaceae bacterium]
MRPPLFTAVTASLLTASSALADPPIDGNTKCQTIVDYLNTKDSPHAHAAFLAIKQLITGYDRDAVTHGKPSALAPLTAQQAEDIAIAGIEYCRDDPQHTLGRAAADVYQDLVDLHGQLRGQLPRQR